MMVKSTEPRPVRRRSRKPGEAPRALMMIVENGDIEDDCNDANLATKRHGVTKDEATAPP